MGKIAARARDMEKNQQAYLKLEDILNGVKLLLVAVTGIALAIGPLVWHIEELVHRPKAESFRSATGWSVSPPSRLAVSQPRDGVAVTTGNWATGRALKRGREVRPTGR
jgi:hypothetical protein